MNNPTHLALATQLLNDAENDIVYLAERIAKKHCAAPEDVAQEGRIYLWHKVIPAYMRDAPDVKLVTYCRQGLVTKMARTARRSASTVIIPIPAYVTRGHATVSIETPVDDFSTLGDTLEAPPTNEVERNEIIAAVLHAAQELPIKARIVIEQTLNGFTTAEIAEKLKISVQGVAHIRKHACKKLSFRAEIQELAAA